MTGSTLPLWPGETIAPLEPRPGLARAGRRRWDPRRYATLDDPAHKSHLEAIAGEYGCSMRFALDRRAEAEGRPREPWVAGQTAMGTAAHAVLERAAVAPHVLSQLREGAVPSLESTLEVVREAWCEATAGLEVRWFRGESTERELELTAEMVRGAMLAFPRHIKVARFAEVGFICPLAGIWLEGHIDLVYENLRGEVCLLDWKRGAQLPHQIALDHGWEGGIYSAALRHGVLLTRHEVALWRGCSVMAPELAREDREALREAPTERDAMHAALRGVGRLLAAGRRLPRGVIQVGKFPSEIYRVQLRDFVAYKRQGSKSVSRPEEIAFYGLDAPGQVRYRAGDVRGPGWYQVRRTEQDVPRLERRLRTIVGLVRMGRFVESIGEKCVRCGHSGECLTSGYGLDDSEMRALNNAAIGLECDGLGSTGLD